MQPNEVERMLNAYEQELTERAKYGGSLYSRQTALHKAAAVVEVRKRFRELVGKELIDNSANELAQKQLKEMKIR